MRFVLREWFFDASDADGNNICALLAPICEIEVIATDRESHQGDDPAWLVFTVPDLPELGVCGGFYPYYPGETDNHLAEE